MIICNFERTEDCATVFFKMDGLYVIHVITNSRELEFLAQAKVKGLTAKDLSDYNFYKPHGRSSLLKI